MNFNDLMAKMRELDQPTAEAIQVTDVPVEECGEMPPAPMGMEHKETPPPSMSVNINAQGMDDISELMKLLTKVNPDMINQKDPASIPSIDMIPPAAMSNDRQELTPLKMLPDFDADNDNKPGGELDKDDSPIAGIQKAMGDIDGDGDHDMDDHDAEEEPKDKEEAFGNAPDGASGPEVKDTEYMINKLAGGMNRPKGQHKHSYQAGDNPMSMPEGDLRAAIRAELLQRLAEAKGAK
jgi:hypothetical protein